MKSLLMGALALLLSGMAFAQQQRTPPRATLGSWEDLKGVCQQPANFGLQIPPGQVNVTCRSTKVMWDLVSQRPFLYPYSQYFQFEAASDKANVSTLSGEMMRQETPVLCPVVRQVRKHYTLTATVTCQQITTFQGNHMDFCRRQLRDESPDMERFLERTEVVDGSEHSLCSETQVRAAVAPFAQGTAGTAAAPQAPPPPRR